MAVSTDFTGRTIDQLIFQGVAASGDQLITTGWGNAGEICTGVQKVAQTWTVLFFTELGSIPLDPTRGSTFIQAVRSGRIRVDDDVTAEFNLAAERIRRIMDQDAVEAGDLPDDERLDEATLVRFTLDLAMQYLAMTVNIQTMAGVNREIILPVSISIR
jgi:hypothetical protein